MTTPPPPTPRKIVAVVWKDIQTRADWVGERATVIAEMKPIECVTVGFLLVENDELIIIADSASRDRDFGGITVIPTGVVISTEVLKSTSPFAFFKGKKPLD